jgi:chemotaxis protein CheZ
MKAPPAQWADLATWLDTMGRALRAADEPALQAGLAKFDAARHELLHKELRRIGSQLHGALESFSLDAGLVEAPAREPLDPRPRLERVLKVSDDAAHRTADLVELSYPLAEQTGASAAAMLAQWRAERDAQAISAHAVESFLDQTVHNMTTVGTSLSEVLLAHGYQDHGARVLRGVARLLEGIDAALRSLQQLGGGEALREPSAPAAGGTATSTQAGSRGASLRTRMGS